MAKINVTGTDITVIQIDNSDYISLTDMAHSQMEEHIIIKWLSLKSTIEYIGEWEILFNPDFNYTEFGTIKNSAGSNNFVLSVKQWIEKTGAIGISAKAGRYGGTYAHKDIAFHFELTPQQTSIIYANEADVLNMALFGMTAKEWRETNPELKGNVRDYATINELICLSNMENLNAVFVNEGLSQRERLVKLNQIAIQQMSVLQEVENRKLLKK